MKLTPQEIVKNYAEMNIDETDKEHLDGLSKIFMNLPDKYKNSIVEEFCKDINK